MHPLLVLLLGVLVLAAAAYDVRYRRIPNWLSVSGAIAGFTANLALFGGAGLLRAALGLLCAFSVYLVLYLIRAMGAGDVKLMAAVGALAGPRDWLTILLITVVIGGAVAFAVIALKRRVHRTFVNVAVIGIELLHLRVPAERSSELDVRSSQAARLPHAAIIAAGSLTFVLLRAGR